MVSCGQCHESEEIALTVIFFFFFLTFLFGVENVMGL